MGYTRCEVLNGRKIALTGLASGTALLMTGCAPDTPRPSGTAGTPGVPPTEK